MRLAKPIVGAEELHEIKLTLESGYCAQGWKVAAFEKLVSEYLGVKHAFATSSCTTALHLTLYALGIGPGDEVLVPDFTFPATSNVIVQCGATPVLVDIELETFTIDVGDLARKVSGRTKAIIPVHLFGLSANMELILDVAEHHDLFVVEDAACALGAICLDRYCGTMGIAGCFSFHPRKVITTGEGGMVVSNDDELAEKVALLRNHGGRHGAFHIPGFNYRMSDIQGAMGVAQMRKLPVLISRRQQLAREFDNALSRVESIQLPKGPPWGNHTYQSYVVLAENRDAVIEQLVQRGIEATLGTYALHRQPMFNGMYGLEGFPNSSKAYAQSLALPFWPGLEPAGLFMALEEILG